MAQIEVLTTIDGNCTSQKVKTRFPKVRRKIQRAFLAWLTQHKGSFKCPLHFVSREDGHLEMTITGLNPALQIYLNQMGIGVSVYWQDFCCDFLVCFDSAPVPTAKGYCCALYQPEHRTYYANREALWQAELFDPFLSWLNTKLYPATWLGLYRITGGSTWAELMDMPDPEANVLLPVWLSHEQGVKNE